MAVKILRTPLGSVDINFFFFFLLLVQKRNGAEANLTLCVFQDVVNDSDTDRTGNNDAADADPADRPTDVVVMVVVDAATDIAVGGRTEDAPDPVTAVDMMAAQTGCGGARPESGVCHRPDGQQPERLTVDRGDGQDDRPVDGKPEPEPDAAAVLQPHTACFDTGNNRQLYDLTVSFAQGQRSYRSRLYKII